MGLFNFIAATKWTSKALLIAYATYVCHHEIEMAVNRIKYYYHKPEGEYVGKEQAYNLEIYYEINGKGNLETYVKNYSERLPVLIRENGIMVGTPEYVLSNLEDKEADMLKKRSEGYYDE